MSLTIAELLDGPILKSKLVERGLGAACAGQKVNLFTKCARQHAIWSMAEGCCECGCESKNADRGKVIAMVIPGRIEVLGKHTDYCGGRSLVCAADRGFCLVVTPRADRKVRIADAAAGEQREFEFSGDIQPPLGDWANYPMTVARRLARNFSGHASEDRSMAPLRGADIAFASDLPPASGMSSSSALVIACFLALSRVNDLPSRPEYRANIHTPEELAGYIATHENGQNFGSLVGDKGVGTFGGSEDHTAILCCKPRNLSLYSYCPVRFERRIGMPEGYAFVIGASGVVAEKTGAALAKYNRASLRARAALKAWNDATGRQDPHLAAAVTSSRDAAERLAGALGSGAAGEFTVTDLTSRAEQFVLESEQIIPQACDKLAGGDAGGFGHQVELSQQLAHRLLGNQIAETVFLARAARQCGAAAASSFGAGFGGAVWAMVRSDRAEELIADWSRMYHASFPACSDRSKFFLTQAGPAAFEV